MICYSQIRIRETESVALSEVSDNLKSPIPPLSRGHGIRSTVCTLWTKEFSSFWTPRGLLMESSILKTISQRIPIDWLTELFKRFLLFFHCAAAPSRTCSSRHTIRWFWSNSMRWYCLFLFLKTIRYCLAREISGRRWPEIRTKRQAIKHGCLPSLGTQE